MNDELYPANVQYYGITGDEKGRIVEVLVTRRDGKQVAQVLTGKRYKNMAAAMFGLEMKNRGLGRAQ